jgi:cytochrome c1
MKLPKTPGPWLLFVVMVLSLLLATFAPVVWQFTFGRPGNVDFYLHQGKYRNIVARAKELPLAPGAQTTIRIDGMRVDAARNASGAFTMTITTMDWHHAGAYGYVFSDVPLTSHPNDNYPDRQAVDNPGDMPFVDKPIVSQEGRWWSVYNDLL